ncbi:MAG: hypothetical protein ACYC91_17105 [Solirubrobacteraceae bacterium]
MSAAAALQVGWSMAEINAHEFVVAEGPPAAPAQAEGDPPPQLPGIGKLTPAQRLGLRLDKVDAGLAALGAALTAAGQEVPSSADVRAQFNAPQADAAAARNAIWALHVKLLSTLSAADASLGKAYGLGRALQETCGGPADREGLQERFKHYRLENLRGWLNDLASALPAHSAKAVLGSLTRWEAWTANALTASEEDLDAALSTLRRILPRQAEMWRAALCGEKDTKDSLTPDDYADAASAVAQQGGRLARSILSRYVVAIIGLLAVVGLIIAFVVKNPTSQVVTGLAAVAAALGITWKGVGSVAEKLLVALGRPLWGAEIDAAVGQALTYLPTEPITEPPNDLLVRTPQYLRAVVAAGKTQGGDPSEAQVLGTLQQKPGPGAKRLGISDYITARSHLWQKPSVTELRYWLTWATSVGYLTRVGDGYRLTGEGSRLAQLPPRVRGAVRAALTASRPSTDGDG